MCFISSRKNAYKEEQMPEKNLATDPFLTKKKLKQFFTKRGERKKQRKMWKVGFRPEYKIYMKKFVFLYSFLYSFAYFFRDEKKDTSAHISLSAYFHTFAY